MREPNLTSLISMNTETRPWTADDWRACLERAKDHPCFEPPPYVVVSPAEFHHRVMAGEITADGRLIRSIR